MIDQHTKAVKIHHGDRKICYCCLEYKHFSEFRKNKRNQDGLSNWCKRCLNKKDRPYVENYRQKVKNCAKNRKVIIDQFIVKNGGCVFCYESESVCLAFHHKSAKIKEGEVSRFLSLKFSQRLIDEIEKCYVVCFNCHQKLHAGKIENNHPTIILPDDIKTALLSITF